MSFTTRLNNELYNKQMTQRELAQRTNVTEATISRYCNGKRTPSITTLTKIANALNVNADYLLGRDTVERARGAHGIINNLNLHLNGVIDNNGIILYEVENLIGDKRYFIHRGIQSMELKSTDGKEFINNKTIIRELIDIHNCKIVEIASDEHYTDNFIEVGGLLLVIDTTNNNLVKWIYGGLES